MSSFTEIVEHPFQEDFGESHDMHLGRNWLKPYSIKCLRVVGNDHHGDLTPFHGLNKIVPNSKQNSCSGLFFPEARDAWE